MAIQKTRVFQEDYEVNARLSELRLNRSKLLDVRTTAVGAAADATPFHPANAAGTFSYQQGTFGLRHEFVDDKIWKSDRPNGVEAISNEKDRVRVVFANVDAACDNEHLPRARSGKGAGAERLCAGNNLFGDLPHYTSSTAKCEGDWITYYLMVAPNGAVELTCATVENNKFSQFIERLYLSDGSDLGPEIKRLNDDGVVDTFDPQVARR